MLTILQVPSGLPHLLALSAAGKAKRQSLRRLVSGQVPSVDVLITYCGEGLDLVIDTVRAAYAVHYPKERYRIVVLDDSYSPNVMASIEELISQFENLYYTSRRAKVVTHSKAANLNHGLSFVSSLPGGPSELVAVLDVDMMPTPQWLRALVPHILEDARVAMANPPQHFYNIPDGDPLSQSMDVLFDVYEPLKNATNSSWCSGSGFVVRRGALDQLGGVPEESMNEDIMTSILLTAAGWKIVYVHEPLQWGMVPSTITAYLKQQRRWCAGLVSTIAVVWNPRARSMTAGEKFGATFPAVAFGASVILNMINIVAIPIILLTGLPVVAYSTDSQLRTLSMLGLLRLCATFIYHLIASQAANYHLRLLGGMPIWTCPFQFATLIRFARSAAGGKGVPLFTPSGSIDIQTAKSLQGRIRTALRDEVFVVPLGIVLSYALCATVTIGRSTEADLQGIWKEFLIHAGWPPVFLMWSTYITDCWIPISYVLSPPQAVPREKLLVRDPTTKYAHPSAYAQDQARVRPPQGLALVKIIFCVATFVSSLYV